MTELHEIIRELVDAHGRSIFSDPTGFRGVLDDVLAEEDATTGDINLLVDAVRFAALGAVTEMVDGGADPARAVEEAGLRLARNRGGDDISAAAWAAAVLGYSVGKVPAAVVLRYRSQRQPSTHLPPPSSYPAGPPVTSPPPPVASPPRASPPAWQGGPGHSSAPSPAVQPGHGSAPRQGSVPQPGYAAPHGYASPIGGAGAKRRGPGLLIAGAVAGVVLVGGGIAGVVAATSGDNGGGGGGGNSQAPEVDLSADGINQRYGTLATSMATGATDCKEGDKASGMTEKIECTVTGGELTLVTYDSEDAFAKDRAARFDNRAGTLSSDAAGATGYYSFDPEPAGSSDAAIVYWDSRSSRQTASIVATGDTKVAALDAVYRATSPRVSKPSAPSNDKLKEFINVNMEVSSCRRIATFFKGSTEESTCDVGNDQITVYVGRFATREDLVAQRNYFKGEYKAAAARGNGPNWHYDSDPEDPEGQYYAYAADDSAQPTLYWDWDEPGCNCWAVAYQSGGKVQALDTWWSSSDD